MPRHSKSDPGTSGYVATQIQSVQYPPEYHRGYMATQLRGYEATRLRGYAATRLRGYAATRLRGYVATWLCGYAATWLRGYATLFRITFGVAGYSLVKPEVNFHRLQSFKDLHQPLRKIYTNHSVRATAISLWSDAQMPVFQTVISPSSSGNSNEQCLAQYSSVPGAPQLRKLTDTISNALAGGTASTVQTSISTALISSPKRVLAPVTRTTTNQIAVGASLSMNEFPWGFFSSCNIGNVHVCLGSKPNQGEK